MSVFSAFSSATAAPVSSDGAASTPDVPAPIKVRRFIDISLMVHPTSLPC